LGLDECTVTAWLETTRIYAKWSDRQLRETIGR
jgi:hypothetical protein